MTKILTFLSLIFLCAQLLFAGDLVLYNGNIIDVRTGNISYNQTIHIVDGRIKKISPSSGKLRQGQVDATGKYIVPGLIDSHTHYSNFCIDSIGADTMSQLYFRNGVTTVRDVGGNYLYINEYNRLRADDAFSGPDIFYSSIWATGDFRMPEYHSAGSLQKDTPWSRIFSVKDSTDAAIEKAVLEAKEIGASGFKLYIHYSKEELDRLVPIIRKHGLRVWAHSAQVTGADALQTAKSGVQVMSHAYMIPKNYYPRKVLADAEYAYLTEVLDAMKSHGVYLDATLALSHQSGTLFAADVIKAAYRHGVKILVGTDLPDCQIHKEISLLSSECGISNIDLLRSATLYGAEVLGLQSSLGCITKGAEADILVLNSNPLDDITALQDISCTIANGEMVYVNNFAQ